MWSIVEEHSYEIAVGRLGGARWVDEALAPIMNAVESNPLAFPEVPGSPGVRLARTTLRIQALSLIPALSLWFRAEEVSKTVYLLYIEPSWPEDMAYAKTIF